MGLTVFLKVILAQIVSAAIIIYILKRVLDNNLIELAIRRLELSKPSEIKRTTGQVTIVSSHNLSLPQRDRITVAVHKLLGTDVHPEYMINKEIMGGAILLLQEEAVDFSIRGRLRQAGMLGIK